MPAKDIDSKTNERGMRRLMIIGPPTGRKTTALLTLPHPLLVEGCPGEKNTFVVPNAEARRVRMWEPVDYSIDMKWNPVWDEWKQETALALSGKLGAYRTVVFDGAHKVFDLVLRAARQSCVTKSGEVDGMRAWVKAHDDFLQWFSMGYYANVEYVVWTAWSAVEKKDPTADPNSEAGKRRVVLPDFMGRIQRTIMGEVNIVYADTYAGKAYWQIRSDEFVEGVGIRVPADQADKLPLKIAADWNELSKVLFPVQAS